MSAPRTATGPPSPYACCARLRQTVPADDLSTAHEWRRLRRTCWPRRTPTAHSARPGSTHPWLLHGAATYLLARGRARTARGLFDDAHRLRWRLLGGDHPDTLASAEGVASCAAALRQPPEVPELPRPVLGEARGVQLEPATTGLVA